MMHAGIPAQTANQAPAPAPAAVQCPNCLENLDEHPENGCVLHAFIAVLFDRGNLSEEQLAKLHADTDVDLFWNDLGPILDKLENGEYTNQEEA